MRSGLRNAGITRSSRKARTSHDCPNRVSITSPIAPVSNAPADRFARRVRGLKPDPANAVTNATIQLTHSNPRWPGSLPASGQRVQRKKSAPMSVRTDANASARVRPNVIPTPRLVSPSSSPAMSSLSAVGVPTENVNAPVMGCESCDTTCQSTTYEPSSRSASVAVMISSPAPCSESPTPSTTAPFPSSSRIESSTTCTPSENSIVIEAGGSPAGSSLSGAGSEPSKTACALAGDATRPRAATVSAAAASSRFKPRARSRRLRGAGASGRRESTSRSCPRRRCRASPDGGCLPVPAAASSAARNTHDPTSTVPIGRKPDSARDGRAATHTKPTARAMSKDARCCSCAAWPVVSRLGSARSTRSTATPTRPRRTARSRVGGRRGRGARP